MIFFRGDIDPGRLHGIVSGNDCFAVQSLTRRYQYLDLSVFDRRAILMLLFYTRRRISHANQLSLPSM